MSVLNLIRPELLKIKNYTPCGDEFTCRLHANELPWAPTSLDNVSLNRYPNAKEERQLKAQLAIYYEVREEQLVLTRGSDDAIDLLMRLFLRPGVDSILQCPPTFPMYAFYAELQQAQVLNCFLNEQDNFSVPFQQLIDTWQPNCKLIMLCQPNNPTGSLIPLSMIADICTYFKDKSVVVIDEAYIDFADSESATTLVDTYDNAVVLRTLSKAYGLAGLRLGAVIAQPMLIQALQKIIPPYLLSSAVLELAQRALVEKNWFTTNIATILVERKKLIEELKNSNWIDSIYPSSANFVLIASQYAKELSEWFAQSGISVRFFSDSLLSNTIRITVGEAKENSQLIKALNAFKL